MRLLRRLIHHFYWGIPLLALSTAPVSLAQPPVPQAPNPFFDLTSLACMDEMRTLGHFGFSYAASLDAFLVEGARAGVAGFYYVPIAPSRGTAYQPRIFFLDATAACSPEKVKRRQAGAVGICTVEAQAGVQPVEFVLNVHQDRYRGFASRPLQMLGGSIGLEERVALPEVTVEEMGQLALLRAMSDWISNRVDQLGYFGSVLDPHGKRHNEQTVRIVESARSIVNALTPVEKACGLVKHASFQRTFTAMAIAQRELRGFVEDAEQEIARGQLRRPAGYAP